MTIKPFYPLMKNRSRNKSNRIEQIIAKKVEQCKSIQIQTLGSFWLTSGGPFGLVIVPLLQPSPFLFQLKFSVNFQNSQVFAGNTQLDDTTMSNKTADPNICCYDFFYREFFFMYLMLWILAGIFKWQHSFTFLIVSTSKAQLMSLEASFYSRYVDTSSIFKNKILKSKEKFKPCKSRD